VATVCIHVGIAERCIGVGLNGLDAFSKMLEKREGARRWSKEVSKSKHLAYFSNSCFFKFLSGTKLEKDEALHINPGELEGPLLYNSGIEVIRSSLKDCVNVPSLIVDMRSIAAASPAMMEANAYSGAAWESPCSSGRSDKPTSARISIAALYLFLAPNSAYCRYALRTCGKNRNGRYLAVSVYPR